jgi:hypothetical protein
MLHWAIVLSVIVLRVVKLSVVMFKVIMLRVIMVIVVLECRYAESPYAECRYAESRYTDCHYSDCIDAKRHYAVTLCSLLLLCKVSHCSLSLFRVPRCCVIILRLVMRVIMQSAVIAECRGAKVRTMVNS